MNAFDADVLIYAANPDHPLRRRIAGLFPPEGDDATSAGVGSYLLMPELLGKPIRDGATAEQQRLLELLSRLDLRPLDAATAQLAVGFCAEYKLKAPDATHLATAVTSGADRFITNNSKDFPKSIAEIEIVYPDDLVEPGDAESVTPGSRTP